MGISLTRFLVHAVQTSGTTILQGNGRNGSRNDQRESRKASSVQSDEKTVTIEQVMKKLGDLTLAEDKLNSQQGGQASTRKEEPLRLMEEDKKKTQNQQIGMW